MIYGRSMRVKKIGEGSFVLGYGPALEVTHGTAPLVVLPAGMWGAPAV